ncbi:Uma2 family endonuclease [Nostocaceae cyanobacterium CENA369]|uniref:Uma2 family endonuclease n=1 Tax=Dendronalium phyllosphericum CENA369 TaxID=1725256 RepID=A0A8J7I7X3_9NOST|nr:Uma2 family endonuclease [Dendronalium phyllosphericum]MBH8577800.1 Uma2 family endonuclease [Dendronalium phyllosphericum CENA369]
MVIQNEESVKLPPLENGDRLTRDQFERRYRAMPNVKKAELIEGVVYVASPLRFESHAEPHSFVITWLGVYYAATSGVRLGDNATVRLDLDNEPQPDALLRIDLGQSTISDDDYIEGAPELVVEIAASSAAYDLHNKLKVYRRNGVQEYIIWTTYENQVTWFRLKGQEYITLKPDADGVIKSEIFPGLWLASNALLAGNLAKVLAVLQEGLNTPEHTDFIHRLSQPR